LGARFGGRPFAIPNLHRPSTVDPGIDPAGNVWVDNNWQDIDSCFPGVEEALSTRCGGQGVMIFYGMAKPVRAPQL